MIVHGVYLTQPVINVLLGLALAFVWLAIMGGLGIYLAMRFLALLKEEIERWRP